MGAGAPMRNLNAEKWTKADAEELLMKAVELSYEDDDIDFIGTLFKKLGTTQGVVDHLCRRFEDLALLKQSAKYNCESNCYESGKKEKINTAMAIVNLKSNHGWVDRQQINTDTPPVIKLELPKGFEKLNDLLGDDED